MKRIFDQRFQFSLLVAITAAMGLMTLGGFPIPTANAQQLDQPDLTQSFPVGSEPQNLAFDGANIWVTNFGDNSVTKLRASDGVTQGTFIIEPSPTWITFDGAT